MNQVALDKQKWDSTYITSEMEKVYSMRSAENAKKLEQEFAKAEAQLTKDNVDKDTLRFEAFTNVKNMLYNKTITCDVSKVSQEDVVANIAKSWFDQKNAAGC